MSIFGGLGLDFGGSERPHGQQKSYKNHKGFWVIGVWKPLGDIFETLTPFFFVSGGLGMDFGRVLEGVGEGLGRFYGGFGKFWGRLGRLGNFWKDFPHCIARVPSTWPPMRQRSQKNGYSRKEGVHSIWRRITLEFTWKHIWKTSKRENDVCKTSQNGNDH